MIETFQFHAPKPGPALLVFGAIHGNEICGPRAINRLRAALEVGELELACGSVTLVPVCNPEAYRQDRRFIDENLNRIFQPHEDPTTYEQKLANVLTKLVASHDAFLDLHDVPVGKQAFTFLDFETPRNVELARALGLPVWITGWPDVFKTHPSKTITGQDTQAYAHQAGTPAILVECGQRKSAAADEAAYTSLRRFLDHAGVLSFGDAATVSKPVVYRIDQLVWREMAGTFARDWQHLDDVRAGELIATYADGRELTAPYDGKIIIPSPNNAIGHEWYYLGRPDPLYS